MIPLLKCNKLLACTPFHGHGDTDAERHATQREMQSGKHDEVLEEAAQATGCVTEYVIVPERYESYAKRRERTAARLAVDSTRMLYLYLNPRWTGPNQFIQPGDLPAETEQLDDIQNHIAAWATHIAFGARIEFFINDERWPVTAYNEAAMLRFNWRLYLLIVDVFTEAKVHWYNAYRIRSYQYDPLDVIPGDTPTDTVGCSLYHHEIEQSQQEYSLSTRDELLMNACCCLHGGYWWPKPDFAGPKAWYDREVNEMTLGLMRHQGWLTRSDRIVTLWGTRLLEERTRQLFNAFVEGRNEN